MRLLARRVGREIRVKICGSGKSRANRKREQVLVRKIEGLETRVWKLERIVCGGKKKVVKDTEDPPVPKAEVEIPDPPAVPKVAKKEAPTPKLRTKMDKGEGQEIRELWIKTCQDAGVDPATNETILDQFIEEQVKARNFASRRNVASAIANMRGGHADKGETGPTKPATAKPNVPQVKKDAKSPKKSADAAKAASPLMIRNNHELANKLWNDWWQYRAEMSHEDAGSMRSEWVRGWASDNNVTFGGAAKSLGKQLGQELRKPTGRPRPGYDECVAKRAAKTKAAGSKAKVKKTTEAKPKETSPTGDDKATKPTAADKPTKPMTVTQKAKLAAAFTKFCEKQGDKMNARLRSLFVQEYVGRNSELSAQQVATYLSRNFRVSSGSKPLTDKPKKELRSELTEREITDTQNNWLSFVEANKFDDKQLHEARELWIETRSGHLGVSEKPIREALSKVPLKRTIRRKGRR